MFPFSSLFLSRSVCSSVERGWMWHLRDDRSIKRNKPIKTQFKSAYIYSFQYVISYCVNLNSYMLLRGIRYGLNALFLSVWVVAILLLLFLQCAYCVVCSMQICMQCRNQMTHIWQIVQCTTNAHCTVSMINWLYVVLYILHTILNT